MTGMAERISERLSEMLAAREERERASVEATGKELILRAKRDVVGEKFEFYKREKNLALGGSLGGGCSTPIGQAFEAGRAAGATVALNSSSRMLK